MSKAVKKQVPVPNKQKVVTDLKSFAGSIERMLQNAKKTGGPFALQRLICRLLTSKNEKIAAYMAVKVVEWQHGSPKQQHEHTGEGGGPIAHTIRFGDGNSNK